MSKNHKIDNANTDIMRMLGDAVAILNMSVEEFWDLTPSEYYHMCHAKREYDKGYMEMYSYAVSVGVNNILNKKKMKMFGSEKYQGKVKMTREKYDELKDQFK